MKDSFVKDLAVAIVSGLVIAAVYEWYKSKKSGASSNSLWSDIGNAFLHPINTLQQDVALLQNSGTAATGTQGMGNGPGGTYNHTQNTTNAATS